MKTTFVISHVPNPRINKRIEVAKSVGEVDLVYWNRDTVDIWDIHHKDISNHEIKVRAAYSNPLKRIFPTINFALKALKKIKEIEPSTMHVANIDMLIIASLSKIMLKGNLNIIYEIADLNGLVADDHRSNFKKFAKFSIVNLEKILVKNINTLIVTSEKFYEEYYSESVPREKVLFIPNVPDVKVFNNYKNEPKERFTIGFIGAVRYKEQMKMLIAAAERCNVKVIFAGAGLDNEIADLVRSKDYIEYLGKYNYNKDIANLYSKVDAVYSVYDADLKNVRLALPNKLYEAVFCGLPLIVAKRTYLSEIVDRNQIGASVNHKDQNELEKVISKLTSQPSYYKDLVESCLIMKNKIMLDSYNEKLKEILSRM